MNSKKANKEYWTVWTLDNWDGHVYYHGPNGEVTRVYSAAPRFRTYAAAEKVAVQLGKRSWPAGFDNVTITHAWTVGLYDRHHEDVYHAKLNAAYAA